MQELGFMNSYAPRPGVGTMTVQDNFTIDTTQKFTSMIEQMSDAGGFQYYSAMNSPSSKVRRAVSV